MSIAAALITITLKGAAWHLTGSVGLLSDAAESLVNLVAAVVALWALTVAARPADDVHHFGHSKAEYFSAAIEGQMILVAAFLIMWPAVDRLLHPQALENVGIGLVISVVASVVNGAVAFVLLRAGRRYRSSALTADAHHLLTDVWTSAGVVAGVLLVGLTGWSPLDPLLAIAVGINIVFTGWRLLRDSIAGLMDQTWATEENTELASLLARFEAPDVQFHGLRTRRAGHHRFAEVHVLVPGAWSVQRGHDVVEDIEEAVRAELDDVTVMCHLEPLEDPRSYGDFAAEVPVAREQD
ncbi:MAG: cation transporter [Austwickia sp.]|nr:cation transporter [Austwickia sp.]MBK8435250.1 cation transporter [Austwickia sp.]MBK9101198.1 cation transporter [Austwickia sp.]